MLLVEIKSLAENVAEHICSAINAAIKEQAANIAKAEVVSSVAPGVYIIVVTHLHKSELSKAATERIIREVLKAELPKDNLLGLEHLITHNPARITVRIMPS